MAAECWLIFEDGYLVCTVSHSNPKLCDTYREYCEHGYPIEECE